MMPMPLRLMPMLLLPVHDRCRRVSLVGEAPMLLLPVRRRVLAGWWW